MDLWHSKFRIGNFDIDAFVESKTLGEKLIAYIGLSLVVHKEIIEGHVFTMQ